MTNAEVLVALDLKEIKTSLLKLVPEEYQDGMLEMLGSPEYGLAMLENPTEDIKSIISIFCDTLIATNQPWVQGFITSLHNYFPGLKPSSEESFNSLNQMFQGSGLAKDGETLEDFMTTLDYTPAQRDDFLDRALPIILAQYILPEKNAVIQNYMGYRVSIGLDPSSAIPGVLRLFDRVLEKLNPPAKLKDKLENTIADEIKKRQVST